MNRWLLIIVILLALPAPPLLGAEPLRVEAVVVAQSSHLDPARRLIHTDSRLRISRVLAGAAAGPAPGQEIVVRQLGGRVGSERLTVIHAPLMRLHQTCTATLLSAGGENFFHPLELRCSGSTGETGVRGADPPPLPRSPGKKIR